MTYEKAASVILNVWNGYQDWDTPPQDEITGDSGFDIAMRMAYDALMEKANTEKLIDMLCKLPGCTTFPISEYTEFAPGTEGNGDEYESLHITRSRILPARSLSETATQS